MTNCPHNAIRHTVPPETAHPKEIVVGDIFTPCCNEAYTTIQLPASASQNTGAGGNILPLHVYIDGYIQTRSAQLVCPLGLDHVKT